MGARFTGRTKICFARIRVYWRSVSINAFAQQAALLHEIRGTSDEIRAPCALRFRRLFPHGAQFLIHALAADKYVAKDVRILDMRDLAWPGEMHIAQA